MRATDILKQEHEILLRVLAALDLAAVGAAHLKPVRPGFFVDTYEFVLDFTEGYHFRKEEEILFKALEDHGLQRDGGEIGSLIHDHEESHRYIRAMLEAAKEWDQGNLDARAEVIWATSGYTGLLHEHIAQETAILFSLAAQTLEPEEQKQVAEAFEKMNQLESGEKLHDKYRLLAEKLELEASEWK